MEENSNKNYKEYVEEIDPQRYWLVLKRRFLPAIATFIICLVLASLRAFLQGPTYEARGKLIFQQRNPTSELTGVGQQLGELDVQTGAANPLDAYLKTQTVVLSSYPLLQQTIQALALKNNEGELIKPDDLSSTITIEPIVGTSILEVKSQASDPKSAATVVNKLMELYLKMNIVSNREAASTARNFVSKELPQAELILSRAAEDLRQFKQRYKIASLDKEVAAIIGQVATLDNQINQTKSQFVGATSQVASIQSQLKLNTGNSIDQNALSESPGVQQALADLQKLQSAIAGHSQIYAPEHPTLLELKSQEASYQNILKQRIQGVVGSQNVSNSSLQMDAIKKQLASSLASAETERLSAQQQLKELQRIRDEYSRQLNNFPELEKRQLLLEQRLAAAKTSYETLLNRKKETELVENQSLANVHILEQAPLPDEPVSSRKLRFLAIGVVAGFFLSIGVAFLLDLIDRSIKTVKDAEALLGYPLLGLIPKYKLPGEDNHRQAMQELELNSSLNSIVALAEFPSHASASYQMLEANLRFLSSDKKVRSIVVTSSVAAEGKSSVAANLAATLAQSGKRVLLVDADMRSPSQHLLWNLSNLYGLSHVLVGERALIDTLQRVLPNLTILSAGVTPPTPQALLDSDTMYGLMQTFLHNYEYVIFDTPPLVNYPDAAVLGKVAEGVLFTLRPRLVTSAEAIAAKTLLSRSNVTVLGLVANAVTQGYEHEEYLPSYLPPKNYSEAGSRQRNLPQVNTRH
jgi:polysaccharide biosynthesis transport protein